ncbi:MAG: biotin/lipoyl-containing protein, partial [Bacteroidales bacterium]
LDAARRGGVVAVADGVQPGVVLVVVLGQPERPGGGDRGGDGAVELAAGVERGARFAREALLLGVDGVDGRGVGVAAVDGNRQMTSLLIGSGLPGGMMGSLMSDLKGVHQGINLTLKNLGKPEINEDQLLVQLFKEVEYIWPMLGYPPLVTPFSQYVKNVALMNIVQLYNGKERFGMIDNNTWDMILGKAGKLPGPLHQDIIALAEKEGKEFFDGVPQDNYPDALPSYREEMDKNGWECGPDDEELFELAMHDRQYRDYKSGTARTRFIAEIETKKSEAREAAEGNHDHGEKIMLSEDNGTVMLYVGSGEYYLGFYQEVNDGSIVTKGQRLFYIEAGRSYVEVFSDRDGKIKQILCKHGDFVTKGTPLVEFV